MKILRKIRKAARLIYKRPKGFYDYCLGLLSAFFKFRKNLGRPVHITIEPTNQCNLCCPICETGSGILNRPKGSLQYKDFKIIIDKIHTHTNSIFLYHMGEPFLNPDLYKMIKYAKSKSLYITTCTNGQFVDAKQLVESGIDEVIFQIGGLSEQTHVIYRIGGNLEQIIQNLKNVLKEKLSSRKSRPKVIFGFIVMKHNEAEIDEFYEFARKLKVDEARVLNPCVRNWQQGNEFLPNNEKYWDYDREAFKNGKLMAKKNSGNRCNWIYISTVILNNGDVVPCCRDVQGDFVMGNVLREDLEDIWNGKRYINFRKRLSASKADLGICKLCSGFEIPSLYIGQ
jgi:radical SAM protein with 4Fe4S-binding SPASM domain